MKVVDRLFDARINALNALLVMNIKEYISVGREITIKNEFQRARVKRSSSVYQLLKEDLKTGCLMPPIVLAVRTEGLQNSLNLGNITEEQIISLLKSENLIILDGLQRTYTLIDIVNELNKKKDENTLEKFYKNSLRVEIYLAVRKIDVLYRMLTLNTGQTSMSTRHQIEILYSDYLNNEVEGIRLFTEKDKKKVQKIGDYPFMDVVEGFNSYLDRNELGITRPDLLENIQNLEKLSKEDSQSDLFKEYITSYTFLAQHIDALSGQWEFDPEKYHFANNSLELFTKGQVLSGYGAAIGKLKDFGLVKDFQDVRQYVEKVKFAGDAKEGMHGFIEKLYEIKNTAKSIGRAQRLYLTYFFRELFNKEGDSFLCVEKAMENGFEKYLYNIG